ncbi:MAG: OmpH family outer membrane protein [Mangrovibacterium sp.]
MKNLFRICLVAVMMVSATTFVQAQTLKFAHINTQELIPKMPDYAAAQKQVEVQAKSLEDQLGTMQKELQTKMTEYQEQANTMDEIVRQAKEEDLMNLQQRISTFQQNAQQKLQQKQQELMQPIFDKANKAIEEVAKEQGVIYVFDTNTLLYKSHASIDLLPLVKTKLGM